MLSHYTICREANALANNSNLSEVEARVASMFRERKAHVQGNTVYLESTCDGRSLSKLHLELAADPKALNTLCRKQQSSIKDQIIDQGNANDWRGNLAAYNSALAGETGEMQERFDKALAALEQTNVKQIIDSLLTGTKDARRMVLDECEGEWDYGRRGDDMPFLHRKRVRKECPIIELIFPMANSAGIDADTVSMFGARCFALAAILERAGYRVAITGEDWIEGYLDYGFEKLLGKDYRQGMKRGARCNRVIIRTANEYGDTQTASLFSSCEFYRRSMFSFAYNCEILAHGLNIEDKNSGHGIPKYDRPIACELGQVFINQDTMNQLFSADASTVEATFKERIAYQIRCEAILNKEAPQA